MLDQLRPVVVIANDDGALSTPSFVERYQALRDTYDATSREADDPSEVCTSMSERNKPPIYQAYDYDQATRPSEGGPNDYALVPFGQTFVGPTEYVGALAQVPSGLPQTAAVHGLVAHGTQPYGTHDPAFTPEQQHAPYPAAYHPLQDSPRQTPVITSFSPDHGPPGTKVTVHFRSVYDFDAPQVTTVIMFGQKRCPSVLHKTAIDSDQMYQYALTADAPLVDLTNSPPTVPLNLLLDDSPLPWASNSIEFGTFRYLDGSDFYQTQSPEMGMRKRKLSPLASPRSSPVKRAPAVDSAPHVKPPGREGYAPSLPSLDETPSSQFRRPSAVEAYPYASRRYSVNENATPYTMGPLSVQSYYTTHGAHNTPSLSALPSPSWTYHASAHSTTRSPSTTAISVASRSSQVLHSPGAVNPPLIRTSTLQTPPTTRESSDMPGNFNPYAMFPANSKAVLKLEGDLNSMADRWSTSEWEAKRRLVQFRRTQTGSVISASFEAVTLEDRVPNSICVSCIWWEEQQECYVTSVDTISLLEALVAVRFTVEEKNRIRRNLEGFRPATVSKTKAESDDFFKLIMGFPNPKPRNIEKDVKVFPWRILATALKKIIGKYASHPLPHMADAERTRTLTMVTEQSASYSSTASALPAMIATPSAAAPTMLPAYVISSGRSSDGGLDLPRIGTSPRSSASSIASQGPRLHTYAPSPASLTAPYAYSSAYVDGSAGLGSGPSVGGNAVVSGGGGSSGGSHGRPRRQQVYHQPQPPQSQPTYGAHHQHQHHHHDHHHQSQYAGNFNASAATDARLAVPLAASYSAWPSVTNSTTSEYVQQATPAATSPYSTYSYRMPVISSDQQQQQPQPTARFVPLDSYSASSQPPTTKPY